MGRKAGPKWATPNGATHTSTRATLPYAHDATESRKWRSHGADLHMAEEIWE